MRTAAEPMRPALPAGTGAPLAVASVMCAAIAVLLGVRFAGRSTGTGLDDRIFAALKLRGTASYDLSWVVQTLGDPIPAALLVLMLATGCWWLGRPRIALLAVAGPGAACLLVIATKHIVQRTIHGGSLTYPSTHTAQATSLAMVGALLAAELFKLTGVRATFLVLLCSLLSGLVMGWALTAAAVHYATDTVGGFCVAVAIVPLMARCIDAFTDRWIDQSKGQRAHGPAATPRP